MSSVTTPSASTVIPSVSAAPSSASSATPSFADSLKRALLQPAFLAAFAVLFVAALSLNTATQYMRLYFKKEAVPLRKELDLLPPRLGPWVQVSVDKSLDPEMLDVLGTNKYIFRDYVDARVVGEETIASFKKLTDHEIAGRLAQLRAEKPAAVIRAAVTYYTGSADTVAHVPDRCYVADGFIPDAKVIPSWPLGEKLNNGQPVQVSLINFEDSTPGRGAVTRNVSYFFQCDGDYVPDPVSVRLRLQNLFEHKAYYAKIEIMNEMTDREKSSDAMRDYLSSALPEIEKCLPDWKATKASE